jgi:hypothetical protein
MLDMTQPLKPGDYIVEFTNGTDRLMTLKRAIINSQGAILYLDAADGRQYNWNNVISIRETCAPGVRT